MFTGVSSNDWLLSKFFNRMCEPNPTTFCVISFLKPVTMQMETIITSTLSATLVMAMYRTAFDIRWLLTLPVKKRLAMYDSYFNELTNLVF